MFNFSAGELLVIAMIAIVIIGPDKLPAVARYVGSVASWLQKQVGKAKQDIAQEMELEDLKKIQTEYQQVTKALSGGIMSAYKKSSDEILNDISLQEGSQAGFENAEQISQKKTVEVVDSELSVEDVQEQPAESDLPPPSQASQVRQENSSSVTVEQDLQETNSKSGEQKAS